MVTLEATVVGGETAVDCVARDYCQGSRKCSANRNCQGRLRSGSWRRLRSYSSHGGYKWRRSRSGRLNLILVVMRHVAATRDMVKL